MILCYSFSVPIGFPESYENNILLHSFSSKVLKPVLHEVSDVIIPNFSSQINIFIEMKGVSVTNNFALSLVPYNLQGKEFDFYPSFGKIIRHK